MFSLLLKELIFDFYFPPGTIRLGLFAQNFERDHSLKISGTVRSKFNLQGQFTLSNFQKGKKKKKEKRKKK